jgi:hypothetical protein
MSFDAGVEVWSVDLVTDIKTIIIGCADGTVRFLERVEGKTKGKGKK